MCGHGTIGLAVTLAHMGRLKPGRHRFETPVGVVGVELADQRRGDGRECRELSSSPRRWRSKSWVWEPSAGTSPGAATGSSSLRRRLAILTLANVGELTLAATAIRDALAAQGVTRQRRRADRSHRDVRSAEIERSEQPQFRPLPRRRLRPVALRDRNQRQARLPPCRRQVAPRRSLGAGKHHRQPLPRDLRTRPERRRSCRGSADARSSAPKATLLQNPADPFRYGFGGRRPDLIPSLPDESGA